MEQIYLLWFLRLFHKGREQKPQCLRTPHINIIKYAVVDVCQLSVSR